MATFVALSALEHISIHDQLARELGAVHEEIRPGYARVSLQLSERMTNFHGTTHGGTLSALAAITLGAAANSSGFVTVATAINMEFLAPTRPPEMLLAEARELSHEAGRVALEVLIHGLNAGELIARGSAVMKRRSTVFPAP